MVSAMWSGTWDVRRFEQIDSTNTYLRSEARLGAPEGVVVVAEHQTAGRGRLDRRWESPPGASLLASFLFRPEFDASDLHLCTAAVALAAAQACREVAGIEALIKWPNDLVADGSKLAGVLAEAEFTGAAVASVVVGIGLNVAWPGPEGVGGTCLNDLRGAGAAPVNLFDLLDALLAALAPRRGRLDTAPGRQAVAAELRQSCATLGQHVRVDLPTGPVVGLALNVDDAGHLVLASDEGPTVTISAGDVVHLRSDQP
jgi:BirA family transcriptional regulator, biotin operon repressor / biotin---[acetyl-CoA-carboxylase] ligase